MGTLETNLDALKGRNPALAARIASHPGDGVRVEKARLRGQTFEYMGRRFLSGYDPVAEAGLQAAEALSNGPDSVILFGLGCGYVVDGIAERRKNAKVIVFEPSLDILKGVLSSVDLTRVLGLEKVFLCADVDGLVSLVREEVEGIDGLVGYQTVPYKITFPEELKEYQRRVRNAHTTNRLGVSTGILSHEMWLDNYFANVEAMVKFPPVDSLRGRFSGVPMVIVGAGPSLDRNAHLLKGVKGKAIVIAAVTAYKALLKAGVIPDLVIAAEKVDLPEYFTYGEEDRRTRFVLGEVSHPNMFKRDVKGFIIYYNSFVWPSLKQADIFGTTYLSLSGGSVTTSALGMGVMFGCDPIVMIGQDLSFGTKRAYSKDSVYISQEMTIDDRRGKIRVDEVYLKPDLTVGKMSNEHDLLWLKGLDGKPVPSKYDWVTFHQWFERTIKEMKGAGLKTSFINATEGGAYIEGMEHIALKEAIDRHVTADHPIEAVISAVEEERARSKPRFKELTRSLESMRASLKGVNGLAKEIFEETTRLKKEFGRGGPRPWFDRSVAKMRKAEERLFKKAEGAGFIWDLVSLQTWRLKMEMRNEGPADLKERFGRELDTAMTSYGAIAEASARFVCKIDGALGVVRGLKAAYGCCGACSGECVGDGHN